MRRTDGPASTCSRTIAGGSGIGTSEQEIHDLAPSLKALPQQHPLARCCADRATHNADAMADALLNPRDRAYSVPQLFDFIERNGLAFGAGTGRRLSPAMRRDGGDAARGASAGLPGPNGSAAMELWRGTMTAHSSWWRTEARTLGEKPAEPSG